MSLPPEMRREVYKHLAHTSPRTIYRAAIVNREAKTVQAHLNILKRALRRRALSRRLPITRRRIQYGPVNYRLALWNARNEAVARTAMRRRHKSHT